MKQPKRKSVITKTEDQSVDLNLLRIFQMLMTELNATRVAERLNISQAAVSASLRRLRLTYGDPLFVRTQRGLRATPRAVLLQPVVDEALALVRSTLGKDGVSQSRMEVVRIGLSDDFEMAFGAELVDRVRNAMPDTRIALRQSNSSVAAQALNDREIDLAVTSGPSNDGRLKHHTLGSSGYLVVYDPSRRPGRHDITAEEYVARDHVLVSYTGLTGIVDDVLAEHGHRRTVRVATSHFSALPFLLHGTDALATLPGHAAEALARLGGLAVSPCPLPFPRYAFGVSWRFDSIRLSAVMQVRDILSGWFDTKTLSGVPS